MIRRDQFGFIVQHDFENPTSDYLDGGDTCSREGIMARTGSTEGMARLPKFVIGKEVVRHPFQPKFSDPKETSRDAIVCYFVARSKNEQVADAAFHYADSWFVNKDFLDPAVKLYLYGACPIDPPLWLRLVGRAYLAGALIWNCYIKPDHEQNQFACICLGMGKPWISFLYRHHPDLNANIRGYWRGWRDQDEIGFKLMETIRAAVGEA